MNWPAELLILASATATLAVGVATGWVVRGIQPPHDCEWEPVSTSHPLVPPPFAIPQTAVLLRCKHECGRYDVATLNGRWTMDDLTGLPVSEMAAQLAAAQDEIDKLINARCSCDGDPIECGHEAARGDAEEEVAVLRARCKTLAAEVERLRAENQDLRTEMDERVALGVQAHVDHQTAGDFD